MKLGALALLATTTSALRLSAYHKAASKMPFSNHASAKALAQSKASVSAKAMAKAKAHLKQSEEDPCGCGEDPFCWTQCLFDTNGDGLITFDEAMEGA